MMFAQITGYDWTFVSMGLLLVASAFFSGSETALFCLSAAHRDSLARSNNVFSRLAVQLRRRPRRLLNTLLLGNMTVNVAFSATAAVMVLELQRSGAASWILIAASAGPLLTVILLGEVIPKMLAYSAAPQWSTLAAGPVWASQKLLVPALWVLETLLVGPIAKIVAPRPEQTDILSAEELAAMMKLSARAGIIDRNAGELLQEIMGLTDIKACDVMVPRVDMVACDIDDDPANLARLFRKTRLRKVPVFEKDLDNILGVVHAKHLLLRPGAPLRELLQPVSFIPASANLDRVLSQLRATGKQLAIVVDEYGGSAGLITLKDVLEEIVGEIPQPGQAQLDEPVKHIRQNEYIISGDLSVHDWAEVFNIDLSHHRISTVGGLVAWQLGRIPQMGDTGRLGNLQFTVEQVAGRRVGAVRLKLLEGLTC
ncbi:MAG: hypothetical protein DRP83_01195 [Planctomycetota bacterium]|nr:MAG: hypothetical protein DRP83_01195 [Planctomycetota bacterium]